MDSHVPSGQLRLAFLLTTKRVQFNDGREERLLEFVLHHPRLAEIRGSPSAMIAAMDEFGRTNKYLMTIGYHKGESICNVIAAHKPKLLVELGGYVGYSAVMFGDAARSAGGQRYVSIEQNPKFAAVSSALLDIAGLGDFVRVVAGSSDDVLRRLQASGEIRTPVDFLFLDHLKPLYARDLRVCEHLGFIVPGRTLLVADNVIRPGAPNYLEYIMQSVQEKRGRHRKDSFGQDQSDGHGMGNPNLVYETITIPSFQMSGVPVRHQPI